MESTTRLAKGQRAIRGYSPNIFATLSIVTVVSDSGGKQVAIAAGALLVAIVATVMLQAPYRGQVEITSRKEKKLDELKDYTKLRQDHRADPSRYIWLELRQLVVADGDSDGNLTLSCHVRSTLMEAFQLGDIEGYLDIPERNSPIQRRVTFRLRPGEPHIVAGIGDNPQGGRRQILLDGTDLEIAKSLREVQPRKLVIEGRLDISVIGWTKPLPKGVGSQVEVIINKPLLDPDLES